MRAKRYCKRISISVEYACSVKEKRWVEFKGEVDSTSIPVEWICWLNGQRKVAPSPEEMAMLEARRQRVKENVALLKKEEEERKAREGSSRKITTMGKGDGPDLKSFIQQLPVASEGDKSGEASEATSNKQKEKEVADQAKHEPESAEPTGSGASFRPGTWQPPS
ncbi:NADH:ubiquinone oxidoreductase, 17.2kDa subunit [Artemisia annua]|uniref:NADH dehydrogenase [ubiquinone] 1 alpha subcomplex subunit 12 n=1 Tax=Artemisia annua TaxID=35608 RepID=A0A2U1KEK0_ARTAN|nr:NADH:ubiquinone oxidoreductase, 17.2kDa subunit [Artemisia annua]